jgi:uncharacterized protein YbaA (DUF1428 family)
VRLGVRERRMLDRRTTLTHNKEDTMYVDGMVVPVPKARLEEYKKFSTKACKLWKDAGALSYVEAVADDVPEGKVTDFQRSVKLQDDEVVVFSWITYKSKEDRDRINKEVMEKMGDSGEMPFDGKRMIMGGFKPILEA